MKKTIIAFLSIITFSCVVHGQTGSSFVSKKITFETCESELDSLIIDPSTFTIQPILDFKLLGNNIILDCLDSVAWKNKEFELSYRTLSLDLHIPEFFLDTASLEEKETAVYIGHDYAPYRSSQNRPLIDNSKMNYNGSISRGFSVGNSQSLVLNSNLNLQLNGNLGNGIQVVAAISDDNIPIQADGNTQLLQEFDKVFIKVSKDRTDVIAGDYDLGSSDNAYFVKYFKKLQGLRLDNTYQINKNTSLTTNANFAISRGKFARQTLAVREGNQGPYKLQGNNGERFLIVLQGSEKVYYDGFLLTRGQDYDYVIDYNNAEIIFTSQRLVRRESRIIVEYEYTDQNYLRSLYALSADYQSKNYNLQLNFYNEQDSKNATGQIDLDSTDISILTNGGENPLSLFRSGIRDIDPTVATGSSIFYNRAIDAQTGDTILVYAREATPASVTAVFSEVNLGMGTYRIDSEAGANGRVYKYVGEGNGNYLPIIQLIAPEKRQMMSLGGEVKISDRASFKGEASLSNFDKNRFSNVNNSANQGTATNLGFTYLLPDSTTAVWRPTFKVNYEFLDKNFNFLNPFRNQEFTRDWNIIDFEKTQEQLLTSTIELIRKKSLTLKYDFSYYDRLDQYTGQRHEPRLKWSSKNTRITLGANILNSESLEERTSFIRPTLDVSQNLTFLKNWNLKFKYLGEKNERKITNTETLRNTSFAFDEYSGSINSPINENKSIALYGKRRIDRLPVDNALKSAATIDEIGVEGKLQTENTGLQWNLTYRDFKVSIPSLINEQNTSTLLGRVDYSFLALKGFLNSVSSLNVGSGQEAKREFQFIKVEKGAGNYIYLGDLNNDGEDQINEYEIAVFADQADFIRVNVVNNEFIRTENQGFNQSFRITPDKLLKGRKDKISKLFSRFSTNSIFRIDQKRMSDGASRSSFLDFNPSDTSTVSYNSIINNILFFNRGNPIYDIQLGNRKTNNKFVQITGFEQRKNDQYFLKTRLNPKRYIDILTSFEIGKQFYDSEFFDNKDLDLKFININPKVVYRPTSELRFTVQYAFENRVQQINEKEESISHEFSLESTWRQASSSSLTASLSIIDIQYSGAINTPVAYAILSGLNDGNNYLWSLNFTRRLSGNVDLTVTYDGRKAGESATVHIGRAQVRANF